MHHSQLPLNLPLIARAASLVRIVLLQKKEIVSGPGAGPFVFSGWHMIISFKYDIFLSQW